MVSKIQIKYLYILWAGQNTLCCDTEFVGLQRYPERTCECAAAMERCIPHHAHHSEWRWSHWHFNHWNQTTSVCISPFTSPFIVMLLLAYVKYL